MREDTEATPSSPGPKPHGSSTTVWDYSILWYIMVYHYGILEWDYRDYRVYWGYIGIMEKKMETIGIIGYILGCISRILGEPLMIHFIPISLGPLRLRSAS